VSARVALATCGAFPQLADDEPLLLDQLRARGVGAEPVVWDDPAVDWNAYELVIVRTTWDYSWRREAFLAWVESLARVLNAADVIRWNTDKRYLAELPHVVPTRFVSPGDAWDPPAGEFVVKPAVASGSRDAARYRTGQRADACAHVGRLLGEGRTLMVQPYLGAVEGRGETALIFLADQYSHAIRKGQILGRAQAHASGLYAEEEVTGREPSPAERRVADEILSSLPWPRDELLYARVDLIADGAGEPKLIELELSEPSLYLSFGHGAAARLAKEIVERL
jgi:glutathione synthase/RimK-type ligase-like ATP-grasp enzyme